MSVGDKCLHHRIASVRISVEHVSAGVKRCRIVKDVWRLTKTGISDMVMEIACGLHNLHVIGGIRSRHSMCGVCSIQLNPIMSLHNGLQSLRQVVR